MTANAVYEVMREKNVVATLKKYCQASRKHSYRILERIEIIQFEKMPQLSIFSFISSCGLACNCVFQIHVFGLGVV